MKEHVIITVFANCGVSMGGGDAYSIGAITVMKAYYRQSLNFICALFRALHEKENKQDGLMTRMRFFMIFMAASFAYYAFPGYLFPILTFFSWVCWAWPHSITAHPVGSGYHGLGVGAFTLDWAGISAYHGSPLVTPYSKLYLSPLFALSIRSGFARFTATLTHVALFHGAYVWDIWKQSKSAAKTMKMDIHAKLMKTYKQVPQ